MILIKFSTSTLLPFLYSAFHLIDVTTIWDSNKNNFLITETLLNDTDCPQDVKCKFVESGKHCTLAYKRIDAKIGWPRTT